MASYAAARAVRGFAVDTLVLLGTPFRGDMRPTYVQAVQRVRRVIQVSGGSHLRYERLGGFFDGLLGITRDLRELLPAEVHERSRSSPCRAASSCSRPRNGQRAGARVVVVAGVKTVRLANPRTWVNPPRVVPGAVPIRVPGASHSGLLEAELWAERGWWRLLG